MCDSSSMASSNEEGSATDGEQSNNPKSQPADYELSISQATDMSDLPNWSDDFFTAARVKRNLTRAQKRQERQLHAAKWVLHTIGWRSAADEESSNRRPVTARHQEKM